MTAVNETSNATNRDKANAYARAWYAKNKAKVLAKAKLRYAQKAGKHLDKKAKASLNRIIEKDVWAADNARDHRSAQRKYIHRNNLKPIGNTIPAELSFRFDAEVENCRRVGITKRECLISALELWLAHRRLTALPIAR